jgi:hypothetical protein
VASNAALIMVYHGPHRRMGLLDSSPFFRQVPGLAVEDHSQGGAPAAQRGRTTLTVIFARREDARREEDGPANSCGAVIVDA